MPLGMSPLSTTSAQLNGHDQFAKMHSTVPVGRGDAQLMPKGFAAVQVAKCTLQVHLSVSTRRRPSGCARGLRAET